MKTYRIEQNLDGQWIQHDGGTACLETIKERLRKMKKLFPANSYRITLIEIQHFRGCRNAKQKG